MKSHIYFLFPSPKTLGPGTLSQLPPITKYAYVSWYMHSINKAAKHYSDQTVALTKITMGNLAAKRVSKFGQLLCTHLADLCLESGHPFGPIQLVTMALAVRISM